MSFERGCSSSVCKSTNDDLKSGTVTVSATDSSGNVSGTFDLTTAAGSHPTGSFASVGCTASIAAADAGSACH